MRWANLVCATRIPYTFEEYLGLTVEMRQALVNEANGGEW